MAKLCHPDLFPPGAEQDKATKVFRRLTELRDAAMQAATPRVVPSPTRQYGLVVDRNLKPPVIATPVLELETCDRERRERRRDLGWRLSDAI
jgi:hypothetical protein